MCCLGRVRRTGVVYPSVHFFSSQLVYGERGGKWEEGRVPKVPQSS